MLKPLGDKVIVKILERKELSSGIILQDNNDTQIAEVIAVGSGLVDGKEVKMEIKINDKVMYHKYNGNQVKYNSEEYIVLNQNDILAIIE